MNGRVDSAVVRVLGFLALVSVMPLAVANDGPPPYDEPWEDKEYVVGKYESESAAEAACEAYSGSYYTSDCSVYAQHSASGGTMAQRQRSYGSNRHTIEWWNEGGTCPDGTEPDSTGQCVEPSCEYGEWPDHETNGSRAGKCMTKCEAAGTDPDAAPEYMQGPSGPGDPTDPMGSGQTACFDGCAYYEQHRLTYYEGAVPRRRSRYSSLNRSCTAGGDTPALTSSAPLDDGCVDDPTGGEAFCMEDLEDSASMQDGEIKPNDSPKNCGTYNGERVCMGAAEDSGACVKNGGEYTCMAKGELPVVPSVGENEIANEDGRVTLEDLPPDGIEDTTDDGQVTVSHGSVVSKDSDGDGVNDEGTGKLEDDSPPTAGSDGADDQAEEQEKSKMCKEAPHLCDGEVPGEVPDVEMPTEEMDVSELVGPGDYPNVINAPAACPQPHTFEMPDALGGGSVNMPYTAFCDFATFINPLVVSLSYLAAFFIGLRILI